MSSLIHKRNKSHITPITDAQRPGNPYLVLRDLEKGLTQPTQLTPAATIQIDLCIPISRSRSLFYTMGIIRTFSESPLLFEKMSANYNYCRRPSNVTQPASKEVPTFYCNKFLVDGFVAISWRLALDCPDFCDIDLSKLAH